MLMRFQFKLIITTVLLVIVLFGAGFSILISKNYNLNVKKAEQIAKSTSSSLCDSIQLFFKAEYPDSEFIKEIAKNISANQPFKAVFVLDYGSVLYSSSDELLPLISESSDYCKLIVSNDVYYIQINEPLLIANHTYQLYTMTDITYIVDNQELLAEISLYIFLIIILLAILLSWAISSRLLKPLSLLVSATAQIENGNLSYRLASTSKDELGILSRHFNSMASQIEENMHKLEEDAEAKDQFMEAFSHELKTPMTSIIGYTELLQSQQLNSSDSTEALNYIHAEAQRLESMSMKLLDLFVAENTQLDKRRVNPALIINDIVGGLERIYKDKGILLSVHTEIGLCEMDIDYIKTVLINVLDNARKAVMENSQLKPPIITLNQTCVDSHTLIVIEDNGKGMSEEALSHITDAFYRVDKARSRSEGGSGLGLFIAAKIINLHNGTIAFESKPNIGTKVTITI